MADISQITLPSNKVFNIKDASARQGLSTKVDIAQGASNANKYLATDENGNVIVTDDFTTLLTVNLSDNNIASIMLSDTSPADIYTAHSGGDLVIGSVIGATIVNGVYQLIYSSETEAKFSDGTNMIIVFNTQVPSSQPAEIAGKYQCTVSNITVENSDWNENDASSPSYVNNRTHYIGNSVNTHVWNQTITFDNNSYYEGELNDNSWTNQLEGGQAYSLIYNGTTYTGNVIYLSDFDMFAIGNEHLVDDSYEDTGAPFLVSIYSGDIWFFMNLSESYTGDVSLDLTLTITPIYKLDSKFLDGKLIKEGTGQYSEIFNDTTLNIASGHASHAEGHQTSAEGNTSHAEGEFTIASGNISHAEGSYAQANGVISHAEGNGTKASGSYSHAEGNGTNASGPSSHAEGGSFTGTSSSDYRLYLTGDANATTYTVGSTSSSWNSLIDLYINDRQITNEQIDNVTNKITSITLSETLSSTAISNKAYFLQMGNVASGINAHTEGNFTVARNSDTHAEGYKTVASGKQAHAEGFFTTASGAYSHAEGNYTTASGNSSHAEGFFTTASGAYSHAEVNSTASGMYSHAEGSDTTASGDYSHTEGGSTTASGAYSHAEGNSTIANHKSQHVFGEYNVEDASTANRGSRGTYVEIVGKGTSNSARSNARTLDWSGNEVLAGKLTVGTGPTENMDVATKQYVDAATAGVSPNLSGLADTNISSPATGQILTYDGTTSKWVNTTSPYMTASQVNELIAAALAEYGDGDTASYGFEDASEVSY